MPKRSMMAKTAYLLQPSGPSKLFRCSFVTSNHVAPSNLFWVRGQFSLILPSNYNLMHHIKLSGATLQKTVAC